MDRIIYIVGPTGVGKTALALHLAKKLKGELINADSVQVYKGLDIVSGKDNPLDANIHLLDVVTPTEPFSVSHFQKLGEKVIRTLFSENILPIVVGGTGLYIKCLVDGIPTKDIPYDSNLRLDLENLSVNELQERLSKKRFGQMNESDRMNKRRLIRAIEIERSGFQEVSITVPFPAVKHLQIGLYAERQILNERIDKRVNERLKNGALEEVKKLFENYNALTDQVKNTNGYKQLFQYLKKDLTFEEAVVEWKISEHQLAKNQMTWFKKDNRIKWLNIGDKDFVARIEDLIGQEIL